MTIAHDELCHLKLAKWQDLHAAKFAFNSPFQLVLENQDHFFALDIVRLLPKRRIVAFGLWQGKQVVAKCFFDPKHAKRHLEKDAAGIRLLQENKIPTPAILYQGMCEDKRIYILLLARIFDSKNLQDYLASTISHYEKEDTLNKVIVELATQHVLGILQNDLHLKNFLITDKNVYTLDGSQIQHYKKLLPKKISMKNLALFLSQLGIGSKPLQESLFRHYAKSRGWLLKKNDIPTLFSLIKQWENYRWHHFEKKLTRDCSDFQRIHHWQKRGMLDRQYEGFDMQAFLNHPDNIFNHPNSTILKAGRSTTVIKANIDNKNYVIKRYNLKNLWHRTRRTLRETRASCAWHLAQKLCFFGVSTAKPVAFIENRWMNFRGKSYLVTEYIDGENVRDYFSKDALTLEEITGMVRHILLLFKKLAKLSVTHGDLKATNILIDSTGVPVLIDLDGAISHLSHDSLRVAWGEERGRFLENFDRESRVYGVVQGEWGER